MFCPPSSEGAELTPTLLQSVDKTLYSRIMQQRIQSIDILRGITIAAMMLVNNPGSWGSVYAPFLHAPWHGYTPTDLVFPFFLFIVGCSIAFAYRNRKPSPQVYKKITIRTLKLVGLGLFCCLVITASWGFSLCPTAPAQPLSGRLTTGRCILIK